MGQESSRNDAVVVEKVEVPHLQAPVGDLWNCLRDPSVQVVWEAEAFASTRSSLLKQLAPLPLQEEWGGALSAGGRRRGYFLVAATECGLGGV